MNQTATSAARWTISTRATGEVLAARVESPGITVATLGTPADQPLADTETWLRELLGVATDPTHAPPPEAALSATLHQALSGLLFYHAELWSRPGQRAPLSLAFVSHGLLAGIGWVGDEPPRVLVDGVEPPIGWTVVRDEDGREAHAWCFPIAHDVAVLATWRRIRDDASSPSVTFEAEWAAVEAPAEASIASPADPPAEPAGGHERFVPPAEVRLPVDPALAMAMASDAAAESTVGHAETPVTPAPARDRFLDPGPSPAVRELARHAVEVQVFEPAALETDVPFDEVQRDDGSSESELAVLQGSTPFENEEVASERAAIEQVAATEPIASDTPEAIDDATEQKPKRRGWLSRWNPFARRRSETEIEVESPPEIESESGFHAAAETRSEIAAEAESEAATGSETEPEIESQPIVAGSTAIETAAHSGAEATEPVGMPDRIPPTPEPAELTARTVPIETPRSPVFAAFASAATASAPSRVAGDDDIGTAFDPMATETAAEAPEPAAIASMPAPASAIEPADAVPAVVDAAPIAEGSGTTAAIESAPVAAAEPDVVAADEPRALRPAPRRGRALAWPEAERERGPLPWWRKPWAWAAVIAALFAGGWLVGRLEPSDGRLGLADRALRGLGFAAPRFPLTVQSRPPGAWIAVDGVDLAQATPATLDLEVGDHEITLSFSGLGSATRTVRGVKGEAQTIDVGLWGSLHVTGLEGNAPVLVSLDGRMLGVAPLTVDSLIPGAHRLEFRSDGIEPWEREVEVRVHQRAEVIAVPVSGAGSALLEVRATTSDGRGAQPLEGAAVWIDGVMRGTTPLRLELPAGPTSIRVAHGGEIAPVQVLDLPAGNQRFATFEFGLDVDRPRLVVLPGAARFARGTPTLVSVGIEGMRERDVREMWLHVGTPEGEWRRYLMSTMAAPTGVVGVAVFPTALFDAAGRARWYASVSSPAGDEYFTEMQTAIAEGAAAKPAARKP